MDVRWQKVKSILADVLDRPSHERASAVRDACRGDEALHREVDRLLQREADADQFFATPVLGNMTTVPATESPIDCTGMHIGAFELKQEIGSGGMGTVYEAVQDYPHRTVALKVLKSGLASARAFERFRQEANVVARMRHPGIAQVYDAGIHQHVSGPAPYFAMEYIESATTLTQHAEEKSLSIADRIHLFDQVCEAVQYGHQRGVIHRDLKPENILVDVDGHAKVIAFGIARSTDADLAAATRATAAGDLMGTLRYMSPEQCRGDAADLDVRTDVYSLGVTLFQLLTGEHPYDIGDTTPFEIPRIIRDVEPKKLSAIDASLRGDLDTIVSKALEKDRDRRYASVSELADDLRRFLHHKPVHARPATKMYRLRKFARRNRMLVAAAAAILLLLLAATTVSTGFAVRESRAARSEVNQRETAEEITRFLSELIYAADPNIAKGTEITVREVLDGASERIGTELGDRPIVEAAIRSVIGQTYWRLGQRDIAERHLRQSLQLRRAHLGNDDEQTLDSMNALALVLQEKGRADEAADLYTRAYDGFSRMLGDEHAKTLLLLNNLGWLHYRQGNLKDAERYFRRAHDGRRQLAAIDSMESIRTTTNLANVLWDLGRPEEAEPFYVEAVERAREELGEQDTLTAFVLDRAAAFMSVHGDVELAESYGRESVRLREEILGTDHLYVGFSCQTLGQILYQQATFDQAGEMFRRAYFILEQELGTMDHSTIRARHDLSSFYFRRGSIVEFHELARNSLDAARLELGNDRPETLDVMSAVGFALSLLDDYDAALKVFQEEYEIQRRLHGEDAPQTLTARLNVANCLLETGSADVATSILNVVYEKRRQLFGTRDPATISVMGTLGAALAATDRLDDALELQRSALAMASEVVPEDVEFLSRLRLQLGRTLFRRGLFAESKQILEKSLAGFQSVVADGHPFQRWVVKDLVDLYQSTDQAARADELIELMNSWS